VPCSGTLLKGKNPTNLSLKSILKKPAKEAHLKVLDQGTRVFTQVINETSDDNFSGLLNGTSTLSGERRKCILTADKMLNN